MHFIHLTKQSIDCQHNSSPGVDGILANKHLILHIVDYFQHTYKDENLNTMRNFDYICSSGDNY